MSEWTFGRTADTIVSRFVEELALVPVEIPPRFAAARGTWKGAAARLATRAWSGDRVALCRVVTLEGEGLEIANVLAVPSAGAGSVIFGADLVSARTDTALVAADLSPLDRGRSRTPPAAGATLPSWAAEIFSDDPLVVRLARGECEDALRRLQDLAARFLTTLSAPAPAALHAGGVARYMTAHRGDDRTRTMLAHIFGAEWTGPFIEQVLYPIPGATGEDVSEGRVGPDAA